METAIKIADARHAQHPAYQLCWLDGQPIEARWDGFPWGPMERKNFLILRTPDDFWNIRGGEDWKVWNSKAEEFKKLFSRTDSNEKFKWEFGYLKEEKRLRMRDRFIDIAGLLASEKITRTIYDKLYVHDEEAGVIDINESLFDLLKYELTETRTAAPIKNQGITSGTFQIGTGGGADYATWTLFAADVNAGGQMDGNLTGEGQGEITAISSDVTFDTDTNGFLLKLTAESGAGHAGVWAGSKAEINYGLSNSLEFDESTGGDLDDVTVELLQLDITGNGNDGIRLIDGGDAGTLIAQKLLIKGDGSSDAGIIFGSAVINAAAINNIIYSAAEAGIGYSTLAVASIFFISNNTCAKCLVGINTSGDGDATVTLKNNLCQGNGTDFAEGGSGYGTTAKNISEDATSPDVAYRSKDLHTNTIFENYAGDDYRLDSGGDSTNLAIADDGENLYGSGVTEDVAGVARDNGVPFWIGASHIVVAGGLLVPGPYERPFNLGPYETGPYR